MGPMSHLWDSSGERRLKKLYEQASAESNPNLRLNRLREIGQILQGNPIRLANGLQHFLTLFLDDSLVLYLTKADLLVAEELGNALANSAENRLRPADIWFRVLGIYDWRREIYQACRLRVRIYYDRSATVEEKIRCARELAERGAVEDEHLNVYVDYLQRIQTPTMEVQMLNLLSRECAVDFDTDKERLKRAGTVARRLV